MEPSILYQDQDLLVLNKPAGITVNNSDTTKGQTTVQDWIEKTVHIGKMVPLDDPDADFYNRAGIVHRLDKETSGILLVAKTPESFKNLQAQFKERNVKKTYVALAHGNVLQQEGEIRIPVGRLPWNRKQFGVIPGGRDSITKYKVLSYHEHSNVTLLELSPETGRTHQIRVHLKYSGHPIFSDDLYGGRKTARADRKLLPRLFLHAAKISFTHPTTGVVISFESDLPTDLKDFLAGLH